MKKEPHFRPQAVVTLRRDTPLRTDDGPSLSLLKNKRKQGVVVSSKESYIQEIESATKPPRGAANVTTSMICHYVNVGVVAAPSLCTTLPGFLPFPRQNECMQVHPRGKPHPQISAMVGERNLGEKTKTTRHDHTRHRCSWWGGRTTSRHKKKQESPSLACTLIVGGTPADQSGGEGTHGRRRPPRILRYSSTCLSLILADSSGMAMESAIPIARLMCRILIALIFAGKAPPSIRKPRL